MKLIMENWKRFLKEAKVVRTDEPYLAEMFDTGGVGDAVGGMSLEQKKAACAKAGGEWIIDDPTGKYGHCSKPVNEDFDEEPLPDENDEVVEYVLNATRVGQSPDEITQGLIEAGLTEEQALAALADAFEQGLPGDEVEVDLDEA